MSSPKNITQHVRQNRPSKPRRDTFSQIFWMEFPRSYEANGRPRRSESIHFSLRTDHNSFGPKFLKTLAEWIAPVVTSQTPLAPSLSELMTMMMMKTTMMMMMIMMMTMTMVLTVVVVVVVMVVVMVVLYVVVMTSIYYFTECVHTRQLSLS